MESGTGDMRAEIESAFSAASTQDAATTVTESSTTPAPATPAPTQTEQAVSQTTTPEAEPGPVPYARFKEVNESANLSKKQLEQLAWAQGIKPEHAHEWVKFYQRASVDPVAAVIEQVDTLVRMKPESAASIRSWAARTLGTRQISQEIADPDPEPTPDIQLEDGRAVYSAAQLAKRDDWRERRLESRFDEKLKPLQQNAYKTQADAEYARIAAESTAAGARDVEAMKAQPHFWENRTAIRDKMAADPDLSLREAYAQVFIEKVVPQLNQATASTLQKKVSASSANPSRPSGATPPPPKDFREALEQLGPEVLAQLGH